MRLHELSRAQQRAFMALAREVVAADERLTLGEVERLDLCYRETGLPAADADAPDAAGDLNLLFDTPRARVLLLLNLLLAGWTDGALDAREAAVVRRTADALGVDAAEAAAMERWAERHAALMAEADRFGAA